MVGRKAFYVLGRFDGVDVHIRVWFGETFLCCKNKNRKDLQKYIYYRYSLARDIISLYKMSWTMLINKNGLFEKMIGVINIIRYCYFDVYMLDFT